MSEGNVNIGCGTHGLWFLLFIVMKLAGTSVSAWSWWWLLLPIVPPLVELVKVLAK